MQLELAFLERPTAPAPRMAGPWDQIDPQAQIAALDILSRLIAQMLAAGSALETSDEGHPEDHFQSPCPRGRRLSASVQLRPGRAQPRVRPIDSTPWRVRPMSLGGRPIGL